MMNYRNLRWTYAQPETRPDQVFSLSNFGLLNVPDSSLAAEPVLQIARDNELSPRDNAIFLLQTAAEIEHSLLVQYLFAAYSLETGQSGTPVFRGTPPPDALDKTNSWRSTIAEVAKEEMAHLLSVQNVLRLIGGPLHLEREAFPYRSDFYPFHFALRKLTKTSLAMYTVAEMPVDPDESILPKNEKAALLHRATSHLGTSGVEINHVGTLYHGLIALIQALDKTNDFRTDAKDWMATAGEWARAGGDLIVPPITSQDEAVAALQRIAEQGEGHMGASPNGESPHYRTFLDLYRAFPESEPDKGVYEWDPARNLAANPNTTDAPWEQSNLDPIAAITESEVKQGRITNGNTRPWAQLFNIRYRMLLTNLMHSICRKSVAGSVRAVLKSWTFDEMGNLTSLADRLTTMPLSPETSGSQLLAGPPFELPYTLDLPDRESDRWRLHADLIDATRQVIGKIPGSDTDDNLKQLLRSDAKKFSGVIQAQIALARPGEDQP